LIVFYTSSKRVLIIFFKKVFKFLHASQFYHLYCARETKLSTNFLHFCEHRKRQILITHVAVNWNHGCWLNKWMVTKLHSPAKRRVKFTFYSTVTSTLFIKNFYKIPYTVLLNFTMSQFLLFVFAWELPKTKYISLPKIQ
jgi:hypothetical protein